MITPKYTFLLPAFKAKFFAEALESIKNQTYTDFICIVSDDCSPENLKAIYDEVVGLDSRFTFRRNPENMGSKSLVSHWNMLVDMCETEFLIMASDDDVYEPNFLEEIDKLTVKYPEVDLFRGRVKSIDEDGELLIHDACYPEYMDQAHFFRMNIVSNFITCESCYCYKTKRLNEQGRYVDFPIAWFSDDATHIMMAKNGCVSTNKPIFGFRQSNLSISNTFDNVVDARKKVEASMLFYQWICNEKEKINNNEEKKLKHIALLHYKDRVVRNVINNLQKCERKDFLFLVKQCCHELGLSLPIMYYYWWRNHRWII